MNLKSIISITGKPGLFKVISQTKNGLVVEAIGDGKRIPVYASDKVSALEDISIYTINDDLPLVEVYEKIYAATKGKEAIAHNSKPEELRTYLEEILPEFDQDRVYNSDLKKLFQWFNLLINADLLKPEEKEEKKEKAPAKKAATKKTTTKKTTTKKPVAKKTAGAKGAPKKAGGVKKG